MKKLNGTIIVTYRCNARCTMCNRFKCPSKVEEEISLETIKKLSFDISNCYLKKEGLKLIEVTILSYISQHEIKEKIISREIISNSEELKTSKTTETKNSKQEEDDFQTLKKENKSKLINKTKLIVY